MGKVKELLRKFASGGGVFEFLRAQFSSQVATWVDNVLAFSLKKILDLCKVKTITLFSQGLEAYVFATIIGQVFGGLTACIINYRWTFKGLTVKFRYVFCRFLLVWLCSLGLNTYFTFLLTEWLKTTSFIHSIFGQYNSDDIFIFVKLFVALIVGFLWNYLMYKHFVYRSIDFKGFLRRMSNKYR